ncbi:hypothetical protein Bbelb_065060 [Branchiostoma belcheri]|nr:hypothetical protein Bbelb_065060 [Branchiostoma belcheri]
MIRVHLRVCSFKRESIIVVAASRKSGCDFIKECTSEIAHYLATLLGSEETTSEKTREMPSTANTTKGENVSALKFVKAYISTTVRMFAIPSTLMLDYFFLQKVPNSFHLAGVTLVMFGIMFVSAHTWWKERQKELRVELLQTLQFDPDE